MSAPGDAASKNDFEFALNAEDARSAASRGSVVIAIAQTLKFGMMFASQLILARLLTPSDFGLVAMISPILAFVFILTNLGLGEILVQSDKLSQDRIAVVFWGSMGLSTLMATVLAALTPLIGMIYDDAAVVALLLFATTTIPLATLGAVPSALVTRRMDFTRLQRIDLVSTLCGMVATIILAMCGARYWSLPLGAMVSTILSVIALWRVAKWQPTWPKSWRTAKDDLSFGANLTVSSLATYVTTTADNIIIGSMNGAVALGYYDRSYRLVVQPIAQLISPIASVAVPFLSRVRSDPVEYREVYLRMLRAALILSVPPAVFCIALGERVVPLLLGDNWLPAARTFSWISVGGLASAVYSSFTWLFISQGRLAKMRSAVIIAAVLNLASFVIGAHWGVEGVAAWGAMVFVFITMPLVAWFATKDGLVAPIELFRCVVPYAVATAFAVTLLTWLGPMLPANPVLWIPAGGVITLIALFVPILGYRSERTELLRAAIMLANRVRRVFSKFQSMRAKQTSS